MPAATPPYKLETVAFGGWTLDFIPPHCSGFFLPPYRNAHHFTAYRGLVSLLHRPEDAGNLNVTPPDSPMVTPGVIENIATKNR